MPGDDLARASRSERISSSSASKAVAHEAAVAFRSGSRRRAPVQMRCKVARQPPSGGHAPPRVRRAARRRSSPAIRRPRQSPRASAPRSRGPPRSSASRDSARGMSATPFSAARKAAPARLGEKEADRVEPPVDRGRIGQRRHQRSASRRAPPPVTVRSMALNSEPSRCPTGSGSIPDWPRRRIDEQGRAGLLALRAGQAAGARPSGFSRHRRRCAAAADISARLKLPKPSGVATSKKRPMRPARRALNRTVAAAAGRRRGRAGRTAAQLGIVEERFGNDEFARLDPRKSAARRSESVSATRKMPVERSIQASA